MSDLIGREAVIKDLITNFAYHYPLFDGSRLGAKDYLVRREDVVAFLLKCPTIEAEPVRHGRWEKICTSYWRWKPDGAHVVNRFKYKHKDCGKVVAKAEPYCPNCGAKMDGGAEE